MEGPLISKWEFISSDYFRYGVARDDLYQMYAYLTRYNRSTAAILLYPYYAGFERFSAQILESWYLEYEGCSCSCGGLIG